MEEKILGLIKHLEANPNISKVFFNGSFEWLFTSHPAFPEVKTREEVLALKDILSNEDPADDANNADATIKELTEKVSSLEEDLQKLGAGCKTLFEEKAALEADNKALQEEKAGLEQLVSELKSMLKPFQETPPANEQKLEAPQPEPGKSKEAKK